MSIQFRLRLGEEGGWKLLEQSCSHYREEGGFMKLYVSFIAGEGDIYEREIMRVNMGDIITMEIERD